MDRLFAAFLVVFLAGCQISTGPAPGTSGQTGARSQTSGGTQRVAATRARANFQAVVERVMPVATQTCRARGVRNCAFRVVVDERPTSPPNAFQTLDSSGRPVIGFTIALIQDARNRDELAFVLGHEAAHHIEGHIAQSQRSTMTGAVIGGLAAGILGLDPTSAEALQRGGATVGSRVFSKDFELEADRLGTVIAARSGFDPVRGARFFSRIPDPGDRFLGTHPPNAERMQTVRRTAANL